YKPFKPVVKKDKLFGRGTEDMKATIASYIFAVKALKQLGIKPYINLEFSFTPDEETGGKAGLEWLLKNGFIKADFALGEGFGGDFISYGNKGMVWFEIEVLGKSCHASQPYRGINSFEELHKVAEELIRFKKNLSTKKTRFGIKDRLDSSPTIVLGGVLSGGKKINIVPDKSTFTIDRRLIPEESVEMAKKEIFGILENLKKRDKNLRFRVKIITSEKPVIVDENESVCRILAYSIQRVLKRKARFAVMPGGTDMRFLIKKGIPAVGYSVLGDDRAHSDDEFVYIKSLIDTTKVFAIFFMRLR
ncbi:MAG: ArgE/DapE family deacylase, partial [Candidatus Omnitrophica bacterium]|nr:ArgE/DapE family deacylase [Candidatus Omnitrophota bacterium]